MAIIKVKEMLIKIALKDSGEITAWVINTNDVPLEIANRLNRNLELLIKAFLPTTEYFGMPAINAVAKWLVKGFGSLAEVIKYDKPAYSDDIENHIHPSSQKIMLPNGFGWIKRKCYRRVVLLLSQSVKDIYRDGILWRPSAPEIVNVGLESFTKS